MRLLFAISVIAFCALCWASFAIARHIHTARRRNRARRATPQASAATGSATPDPVATTLADWEPEALADEADLPGTTFGAPPPPKPLVAAVPNDVLPRIGRDNALDLSPVSDAEVEVSADRAANASGPVAGTSAEPDDSVTALAGAVMNGATVAVGPHVADGSSPEPDSSVGSSRRVPELQDANTSLRRPHSHSADRLLRRVSMAAQHGGQRSDPSEGSDLPTIEPGERRDWEYFNKDMGDLSDPVPPKRPLPRRQ